MWRYCLAMLTGIQLSCDGGASPPNVISEAPQLSQAQEDVKLQAKVSVLAFTHDLEFAVSSAVRRGLESRTGDGFAFANGFNDTKDYYEVSVIVKEGDQDHYFVSSCLFAVSGYDLNSSNLRRLSPMITHELRGCDKELLLEYCEVLGKHLLNSLVPQESRLNDLPQFRQFRTR
jgi:hypothetical protein